MDDESLSDQGMLRRQQILLLAKAEARRRRRRRLESRWVGIAALTAMALAAIWQIPLGETPVAGPWVVRPSRPTPPAAPSIVIQYVQTDPTITDRLTIPPQPPRWTSIGDTELLQELAAAGQPAGIVCINGKTILLPRGEMR